MWDLLHMHWRIQKKMSNVNLIKRAYLVLIPSHICRRQYTNNSFRVYLHVIFDLFWIMLNLPLLICEFISNKTRFYFVTLLSHKLQLIVIPRKMLYILPITLYPPYKLKVSSRPCATDQESLEDLCPIFHQVGLKRTHVSPSGHLSQ